MRKRGVLCGNTCIRLGEIVWCFSDWVMGISGAYLCKPRRVVVLVGYRTVRDVNSVGDCISRDASISCPLSKSRSDIALSFSGQWEFRWRSGLFSNHFSVAFATLGLSINPSEPPL